MPFAGQAGRPLWPAAAFRDRQQFDPVFPFVVVAAKIGQLVAGAAKEPPQTDIAPGPDFRKVPPGRARVNSLSVVDEEMLERFGMAHDDSDYCVQLG